MTICAVSALDSIRDRLMQVHDLITLATGSLDNPNPEGTALRLARQMADSLVGDVDALVPAAGTDDPLADLKAALVNLAATGYDMTSIRVSFATRSLIVYWHTGVPTIDSFGATSGEPVATPGGNLPAGPMEPAALVGEAAQA